MDYFERYLDTRPNTTINLSIRLLERIKTFVDSTPEIRSRNALIEKAVCYVMDNWADIKDDFLAESVA